MWGHGHNDPSGGYYSVGEPRLGQYSYMYPQLVDMQLHHRNQALIIMMSISI